MTLIKLNDDVLHIIVSYLAPRDALRLSMASKFISPIAIPHAVCSIVIGHPLQLTQFCKYMFKDTDKRLRHMRELEISDAAFSLSRPAVFGLNAKLLAHILQHPEAASLQRLSLKYVEELLSVEPLLSQALAALPYLTQASFGSVGVLALMLLQNMRSKLRALKLSGVCVTTGNMLPPLFSDVPPSKSVVASRSPTSPSSPSLQSAPCALEVEVCILPMASFVNAFPDIQSLRIDSVYDLHPSPDLCWPHLDYLSGGSPGSLRTWMVTCPVRHLELDRITSHSDEQDALFAVRNTIPVILSLETYGALRAKFWTELVDTGSRLRYLKLILRRHSMQPALTFCQTLQCWMGFVTKILCDSQLVCFRIQPVNAPSEAMEIIQGLPVLLKDAIPTLRYVAVDEVCHAESRSSLPMVWWLHGGTDKMNESKWWRIVRSGASKSLVPISCKVSERVEAYLNSAQFESSLQLDDSDIDA